MPQDILRYLADFGIAVCTVCKFAVQPQAISSHLLRHKIYRDERHRILSTFSKLGLVDPDDIVSPSAHTSPLPDIPVFEGLACCAPGCDHLCISPKRMKQHWRVAHHESDSEQMRSRPARMQTFFRGTKIHYFEVGRPHVAGSVGRSNGHESVRIAETETDFDAAAVVIEARAHDNAITTVGLRPSNITHGTAMTADLDMIGDQTDHILGREQSTPSPQSASTSSVRAMPNLTSQRTLISPSLEMSMLRYFHHYTITSSIYPRRSANETLEFWRETIPQEAFAHEFLMNMILAFAATHMALTASDSESRHDHRENALHYQSTSIVTFQRAVTCRGRTNSVALIAYTRFIGLQQFAQHQLVPKVFLQDDMDALRTHDIVEIILLMRGGVEMNLSLQDSLPEGSELTLSKQDIASLNPDELVSTVVNPRCATGSCPLWDRIDALPSSLAEFMPASADETSSIRRAIYGLRRSCVISHSSDNLAALWNGVDSWPLFLTEDFIHMIATACPAALVIFAYWCVLLRRLERHNWCLPGGPQRLLDIVKANLSPSSTHLLANL